MAHLNLSPALPKCLRSDTRGVVYVEFLFAFFPLFSFFLAICQLSLTASAELIVQHAASQAARSAIVVLEEAPEQYDGAPRGDLLHGAPAPEGSPEALLSALGFDSVGIQAPSAASGLGQNGARMQPIRLAAYMALLTLAPDAHVAKTPEDASVGRSLSATTSSKLRFALSFTRGAAVVTAHASPSQERPAYLPFALDEVVTIRVSYLYHCGVPLVSRWLCTPYEQLMRKEGEGGLFDAFDSLIGEVSMRDRLLLAEDPHTLGALVAPGARFKVISAQATLPIQGARYTSRTQVEDDS